MATKTDITLTGSISADADFRSKSQFIHDVLALGWTQTSDTGQINLATVTKPVGSATAQGYEIWRMADTLQATAPLFMKIEYGSFTSATVYGIWFTIGTGSDGAGNITGIVQARTTIGSVSANVSAGDCFGSSANNRFGIGMFAQLSPAFWFSLERTKDSSGADTATGFIIAWGSAAANHKSRYVPFAGSIPTTETGLQYILSSLSPSTFGSNTGIGIMLPMAGVAQQPGMNVAVVQAADFSTGAQITFTIYGATHTYQIIQNVSTLRGTNSGLVESTGRLAMRYE